MRNSLSAPAVPVPVAAFALLAGLAGPAAAQGISCGGVGDGAPWLGQTRAGSDIAAARGPLALGAVDVPPGTRFAALFTLGAPMALRLEAAPVDAAGDTVLELFDATGRLVVVDDDSGGGLASRAEPDLPAGEYCLAVTGFGGAGVRADLQVSRLEMAALTPGLAGGFAGTEGSAPFVGVQPCLPSTPAVTLGQGPVDAQLAQGLRAVETAAAAPYYRFTLGSAQSLTVRAENPAADPYIYVFDASGALLAENDDHDGLDSRIDFATPLPAGEYCIGVRALSDPDLPVTLTLGGTDARAMLAEQYAAGEVPPPLDGSWPVEDLGLLPPQLTRDLRVSGDSATWVAMEVPVAGLILISADEVSDSDPVISFFDAEGEMLGFNDDANGTLNAQLSAPVEPGRYMLAVQQYSADYQGVIRVGIGRYVPATE